MPTLQRQIGYAGDIEMAPVEDVSVEFDVPLYEYVDEGDAPDTDIRRHITNSITLRLLQPLASNTYRLTVPDELVVPEGEVMRSLYALHHMQARSLKRVDNLASTIAVRYYADPGPLIGRATIEVLHIPDLEPFAGLEDDIDGSSLLVTTPIAIDRRAYEELVSRLAASLIEIDDVVLLDVVSYMTDVTDGGPAPVRRVSAKVRQWIIDHLSRSGVGDAERAYEIIRAELRQLYEFTLVVPEMKPVAIGGRFTLIPAGIDRVAETDFSFFHLSAEFSTMGGNGAHISRRDFARPLHVEHDSVAFSLSNGSPVFQGAVTTPVVVNVKAFDGSVVWTREYEASDDALADLDIEVALRRPSVLDPRTPGTDVGMAKKLRGQVLDIDSKCPVKDLTVLVQARSAPGALWRVVGAATSDGSGNFSMAYPFGVFTEAEALVSLAPDAPAPIPVVVGEEPNQSISDDFLFLVVRGVDCPQIDDDPDCDCHGAKKASRLPDHADLIGSDEYSQDIGGACVNLSSPNRTLSEFSYQAVVRTSDPDVANYTLHRSADGSAYDLVGARQKRPRKVIDLDNPVAWQDAPEDQRSLSFYQAVTIATGHILHYRSVFKADGYSLGDLVYSLALAPGQKKEIVVFDSSHSLLGAESQALSQGERLASELTNEREITSALGGGISESLRGSSSANTSGISAGLGVGAIVGPVAGVLGVSGGVANSNSSASQNSSRDVSQAFGEMLRQSIMQNAEGYRQLNASVVSTVQEGQRYGVTSEVVANHNHCHALTMMYFEVLRHYAIYQELSSAEECVFLPFLMTNFTRENIYKWRDVLAPALLPMPSETYLPSGRGRQHPLLKAFDANERIKTGYAHSDYPSGSYDDEQIQFVKGSMMVRADLPRPRTRYDRIKSLPVATKTVTSTEIDPVATAKAAVQDSIAAGLSGGFSLLFTGPPGTNIQYSTKETQVLVKQAIFDAFMTMDANYQSVPPAQCIRVTNFEPTSITFGPVTVPVAGLDFFLDGIIDRALWTAYARLLGFNDVLKMLGTYFKGALISEWDSIFYNELAPLVFERIVGSLGLTSISTDFTSAVKYKGGERLMRLNVNGSTNLKRKELPLQLELSSSSVDAKALREFVTLTIDSVNLTYSTSHFNGTLFSGSTGDDLLDGTTLFIPESAEEKRNPRTEDAYLIYKLIEHLNSNLEYYNKVLWYNLDPDRRYMLLDGFNIEVFDDEGLPAGRRSVASVVKNSLVTITGNSLVFPVAPGYRVSQSYLVRQPTDDPLPDDAPATKLLDHYQPLTPIEPYRISIPSKGVFAEAIQGACNACEKLETDRLQDWNRFPSLDEPTLISPITTPTPGVTDWKAAFAEFASPMVNIQNAPGTPAPGAGLAGLTELLGKSGVFKDITGLDANQQNVLKTYLSNQENVKALAQMASGMAMQAHNTQNSGRIMDSLKEAKDSGALSSTEYGKLVKDHLEHQIDGGQTKQADSEEVKERLKTIGDATSAGQIDQTAAQELSRSVLGDYASTGEVSDSGDAAARLMDGLDPGIVSDIETSDGEGNNTVVRTGVGGSSTGGGIGSTARRFLSQLVMGAGAATMGSEPTIAESRATGEKLPMRRLSLMTKSEFFAKNDAAREAWYRSQLGPFSKQLYESGRAHGVPPQLVAAIIFAELIDISPADIAQDMTFMTSGSLGVAQIQVSTAIGEKLYANITAAEMEAAFEEWAVDPMAIGAPASALKTLLVDHFMSPAEKQRLAVVVRLRTPQHAIDGCAKLVRLHLTRAARRSANTWPSNFGFTWTGIALADPQDIYNSVTGGDQSAKEENLAEMVAAMHNTPSIVLATTIDPDEFGNAASQGDSGRRIAEDLVDMALFRPVVTP